MADIKENKFQSELSDSDGPPTLIGPSGRTSLSPDSDTEKAGPPKTLGSDAPDGGITAWLVVVGTWCTSFCSFGWLNSKYAPLHTHTRPGPGHW